MPHSGETPQPMQTPSTPQVCNGPLEPVVHARQIEHSTEQSGGTHTRVSKALRPRLGDKEAKQNKVTFCRVELELCGGSADTSKQEAVATMAGPIALSADCGCKYRNKSTDRLLQVTAPNTDARVIAFCREVKDVNWGNTTEGTRLHARRSRLLPVAARRGGRT